MLTLIEIKNPFVAAFRTRCSVAEVEGCWRTKRCCIISSGMLGPCRDVIINVLVQVTVASELVVANADYSFFVIVEMKRSARSSRFCA